MHRYHLCTFLSFPKSHRKQGSSQLPAGQRGWPTGTFGKALRLTLYQLSGCCDAPWLSTVRTGFARNFGNPQDPVDDLSLLPMGGGFSNGFSTLAATEVLGLTGITGHERTEHCLHPTGIDQCGQRLRGRGPEFCWMVRVSDGFHAV